MKIDNVSIDNWGELIIAKELAAKLKPDNPEYVEDMFLLGILHDFAYEFRGKGHALAGGEILERNGYRYWREVSEHGYTENVDMTDELFILDCADMSVGPNGEDMTFEERAEDIALRYGHDSDAHIASLKEMAMLKSDARYALVCKK